jgi:hypothetical protein
MLNLLQISIIRKDQVTLIVCGLARQQAGGSADAG